MQGFISRIQHYSTKDGPGIRSTVFMVGCNLHCAWCSNPELISHQSSLLYYRERCHKCGSCALLYPQAIAVKSDGCQIDRSKIADFDALVEVCPYDCYEKIGYWIDSDELLSRLLKDKEFYDNSDGGVTFSGGEAALQSDFVLECTNKLHEHGVKVALDTAGNIPFKKIKPLIEAVDLVLYDIKHSDSKIHEAYTGVSNELILNNLKEINKMGKDVFIRMVTIPGLEDLKERIDLIKDYRCIRQIDILPYHIMGVGKYERLGLSYTLNDLPPVNDELIEQAVKYGEQCGLKMTVGG